MNQNYNNIDQNNSNLNNNEEFNNNTSNNNSNKNFTQKENSLPNFKDILEIVLTGLFLFTIVFLLFNTKADNSKLLEKYTYTFSDSEIDLSSVDIETQKITKKENNLNIKNEFISFNIPYSNYEVDGKRQSFVNSPNNTIQDFYKSTDDSNQRISISYTKDGYKDLTGLTTMIERFSEEYNEISFDDFIKRNNINNEMDFELSILKNKDKKLNKNSGKDEIIDKFILDYFTDYLISTSVGYSDKLILFAGDVVGYAWTDENSIIIKLKNSFNEYEIEIRAFGDKINLKYDDIIDIVSSIEFNI